MSALEQIRKRPALVISVLGVALLLFIITLAWDNKGGNPFSNPNSMAKVDGVEIEYTDFREQTANAGNNQDMAIVQDQAMQQLISKTLLDKAIADAGITVSDAEVQALLFDPEVNPQAQSYMQQYNMIFDTKKSGLTPEEIEQITPRLPQLKEEWNRGVEALIEQRRQMKFLYLLDGALTANKLDVKDYAQTRNDISHVRVASVQPSTLPDDGYEATDAEIKEYYDKERGRWVLNQEQRVVSVIRQYIEPSEADTKAAEKLVADVTRKLRDTDGLTAIADNYAFTSNNVSAPLSRLPKNIKDSINVLMRDTVMTLTGAPRNHYNIAKLLSTSSSIDSVTVSFVVFDRQTLKADSVLRLINSGADLTGNANVQRLDSLKFALADPQYSAIRDLMAAAELGAYNVADEKSPLYTTFQQLQGAGVIYDVIERDAPVTVYDVAVVDYRLEPSTATVDGITTKLRDYANKNNTADAFRDNAVEAEMNVLPGQITNTSFAIATPYGQRIPDSTKATRWLLEAEEGQVSDVFNGEERTGSGDAIPYVMVVALNDVFDGDYVPADAQIVKDAYKQLVINNKKGDKLVADYKGKAKNVEGYAKVMKTSASEQDVSLGRNANEFAGRVAAAKKNTLVGPFKTEDGTVYVFTVTDVNAAPAADYDSMKSSVRQQMFGGLQRQLPAILLGHKHIKGDVSKFLSND